MQGPATPGHREQSPRSGTLSACLSNEEPHELGSDEEDTDMRWETEAGAALYSWEYFTREEDRK